MLLLVLSSTFFRENSEVVEVLISLGCVSHSLPSMHPLEKQHLGVLKNVIHYLGAYGQDIQTWTTSPIDF
jgi:hypothetical protein